MEKLRIALQKKGRLHDDSMKLLKEAGIKFNVGSGKLVAQSPSFPIEVLFLRDDDIPQTIADKVADIGLVGENEVDEKDFDLKIAKRLGFSKCRISLALPKSVDYPGLQYFQNKKVATSYPVILQKYFDKEGIKAEIHEIAGSVEIAPGIGLADGIFDIVSSGSTLVANSLKEVEVVIQADENRCIFGQAVFIDSRNFQGSGDLRIGLWKDHKDSLVARHINVTQDVRQLIRHCKIKVPDLDLIKTWSGSIK